MPEPRRQAGFLLSCSIATYFTRRWVVGRLHSQNICWCWDIVCFSSCSPFSQNGNGGVRFYSVSGAKSGDLTLLGDLPFAAICCERFVFLCVCVFFVGGGWSGGGEITRQIIYEQSKRLLEAISAARFIAPPFGSLPRSVARHTGSSLSRGGDWSVFTPQHSTIVTKQTGF